MKPIKIVVLHQDHSKIFQKIKHKLKVIPSNVLDDMPLKEPDALMSSEMFDELADVIEQYQNRKVSDSLQKVADKNPLRMFKVYCKKIGLSPNWSYIESVYEDLEPIIITLKEYYNRPRPSHMADMLGIDWSGDTLSSAQTASYPSGHTIQAYVVGFLLSNQFPERKNDILKISQMISNSRIDRGVHFPSDLYYGMIVAQHISNKLINL